MLCHRGDSQPAPIYQPDKAPGQPGKSHESFKLVAKCSSQSSWGARTGREQGCLVVQRVFLSHSTAGLTRLLHCQTLNPKELSRERVSLLELLSPNNQLKLQLGEETMQKVYILKQLQWRRKSTFINFP